MILTLYSNKITLQTARSFCFMVYDSLVENSKAVELLSSLSFFVVNADSLGFCSLPRLTDYDLSPLPLPFSVTVAGFS